MTANIGECTMMWGHRAGSSISSMDIEQPSEPHTDFDTVQG